MKYVLVFIAGICLGALVVVAVGNRYSYDYLGSMREIPRRVDTWSGQIEIFLEGAWKPYLFNVDTK